MLHVRYNKLDKDEVIMGIYEHEAYSVDVGTRLRQLREERNMSMRSLATASGLSANALSMIERGKTSPSVSTLYKLADAMGVPITTFFGEQTSKQQVIFLRAQERPRVPFARGVWEGLGGEQFSGRVEPFMLTLENGASSGPHLMAHSGHEFVICLRGQLEYYVEKEIFNLGPGDSLLFAAQLNHRWRNPGGTVANALIVLSGFSEDEQPHVMHWKKNSS
jgi:transcriptional regulator with XRE-family HTH domain